MLRVEILRGDSSDKEERVDVVRRVTILKDGTVGYIGSDGECHYLKPNEELGETFSFRAIEWYSQ